MSDNVRRDKGKEILIAIAQLHTKQKRYEAGHLAPPATTAYIAVDSNGTAIIVDDTTMRHFTQLAFNLIDDIDLATEMFNDAGINYMWMPTSTVNDMWFDVPAHNTSDMVEILSEIQGYMLLENLRHAEKYVISFESHGTAIYQPNYDEAMFDQVNAFEYYGLSYTDSAFNKPDVLHYLIQSFIKWYLECKTEFYRDTLIDNNDFFALCEDKCINWSWPGCYHTLEDITGLIYQDRAYHNPEHMVLLIESYLDR